MEDEISKKIRLRELRKLQKKNLDNILSSSIFNKVIVDAAAMHKLKAYSLVLKELAGDYECMGYLLSPPDSHLVWDVILCKNQHVTRSFGQGFGLHETTEEISSKNLEVIGFWHSHAGHGFVTPSSIDTDADKTLFSAHQIEVYSSLDSRILSSEVDKPTTYIIPSYSKSRRMSVCLDPNGEGTIIEQQEISVIKFIYNMIINNEGNSNARILYKILEEKGDGEVVKLDINIDESKRFSPYIKCSYLDIARELLENIFIEGKPLREYKGAVKKYENQKTKFSERIIKNNSLSSAPLISLQNIVIPSSASRDISELVYTQQQLQEAVDEALKSARRPLQITSEKSKGLVGSIFEMIKRHTDQYVHASEVKGIINEAVDKKREQIEEQKQQIIAEKSRADTIQKQFDNYKDQVTKQVKTLEQKASDLEQQVKILNAQLSSKDKEHEEKIKAADMNRKEVETKTRKEYESYVPKSSIEKAKQELATANSQIASEKSRADNLQSENSALQTRLDAYKGKKPEQVESLEQKVSGLESNATALTKQLSEDRERTKELQQQIEEHPKQIDAQKTEYEKKLAQEKSKATTEKSRADETQRQFDAYKGETTKQVTELEQKSKNLDKKVTELNEQIKTLNIQPSSKGQEGLIYTQQQLDDAKSISRKGYVRYARASSKRLLNKIEDISTKLESVKSQLEIEKSRTNNLYSENSALQTKLDNYKGKTPENIYSLEQELTATKSKLEEVNQKNQTEEQIQTRISAAENYTRKRIAGKIKKAAIKLRQGYEQKLAKKDADIESYKTKINELELARSENKSTLEQVAELEQKAADLEKKLFEAESKLSEKTEIKEKSLQPSKSQREQHYQDGLEFYRQREYIKAKVLFEKCVPSPRESISIEHTNYLRYIGNCLRRSGPVNWEDSLRIYKQVLGINPNDSNAQQDIAWILWERRQVLQALIYIEKAVILKNEYAIETISYFSRYCRRKLTQEEQSQFDKCKLALENVRKAA